MDINLQATGETLAWMAADPLAWTIIATALLSSFVGFVCGRAERGR